MRFRIFVRICTGWCFTMSSISLGSLSVLPNGEQTVYGWGSQCFLNVSALTGMLCPPRWACLRSCLPSGLGCCVRLAGLVFLLSAVLSPVLSAILAGMPCPPRWAVSGLVSQLVSHLVWGALSASLGLSFSCLWSCLPLLSLFCLVAFLSSGMLCLPPLGLSFSCLWSCLPLVWDAVFAFLARLPAQLVFGLVAHPVFQLGLSPKFHVRFVQLFGVYGGVIFMALSSFRKSLANRRHLGKVP